MTHYNTLLPKRQRGKRFFPSSALRRGAEWDILYQNAREAET